MRFLRAMFSGNHERSAYSDGVIPDSDVEALDQNGLLDHTRKLMTLSRRRRCAAEQMGASSLLHEGQINTSLIGWYMHSGLSVSDAYQAMQKDLVALTHDPSTVSPILQTRVLLTNEEEDIYNYGQVDPFNFSSNERGLTLRDTLNDHLRFPDRVSTITSFDPEVRGHRHQIRYFRALLVAYSMAHVLQAKTRDPQCREDVITFLEDEKALASGWFTTVQQLQKLSVDPKNFEPDECLLYSREKVYESAALLYIYGNMPLL